MKKKCIVIETDNSVKFESELNQYLNEGYEIKTSSCNTRLYKAVLVLNTEKENTYGIIERMEKLEYKIKVYIVWADTWNAPYGCNVSLFGVYSTKELAENAVVELNKEDRTGMGISPLRYYIAEFNMNECDEVFLDGYYE